MQILSRRTITLLLALGASVYLFGLFIPVMDIDAAQYASISREMSESGRYLTVFDRGQNYLDKPPLLFWLSALSFKLLGVSTAAYKLPSLLFILLGFYATFRLAARLFDRRTGLLSAALLASCEAFIYFTNDVRTDALLAASVIVAIWQIVEFSISKKPMHFLFGFLGIALAMLSKGPIGLMVPALALGSYFVGKRDFRMLFKWYWLAGAALVLVFLSPMLWGLYRQFGMQGIKFYFWTQSFGRLTGENVFKDSTGYFFFVHTFLWAFLPWMLLAYYGIGVQIYRVGAKKNSPAVSGASALTPTDIPNSPRKAGLKQGPLSAEVRAEAPETVGMEAEEMTHEGQKNKEKIADRGRQWLLLGGFILPFIAFSLSHYKLPHYIFVIFPLVAILTARTILELVDDPKKRKVCDVFYWTQLVLCMCAWVFALVCMTIFFPCANVGVWCACAVSGFGTFFYTSKKYDTLTRLVLPSICAILGVNLMLNGHFFPKLLTYQSGYKAACIVRERTIPKDRFFAYRIKSGSADFYLERTVPCLDSAGLAETLKKGVAWIYTEAQGITLMQGMGYSPDVMDSIAHKHITKVTSKFLFFKTRDKTVGKHYVVRVDPAPGLLEKSQRP
jgi:4-amino-4-deoxy-L-arabinose transferase-like glycosyltransferase